MKIIFSTPDYKQLKNVAAVVLTVLFLFSSTITISIPLGLSRSGYLDLYWSELVIMLMVPFFILSLIKSRQHMTKSGMLLAFCIGVFVVNFVTVEAIRFSRGDDVLQSLLAVRVLVSGLILTGVYVQYFRNYWKPILVGLLIFGLALNVHQVPSWNNIRMSGYLGNSFVFALISSAMIPVGYYVILRLNDFKNRKVVGFLSAAVISFGYVFPIWSGSRILILIVALLVILGVMLAIYHKRMLSRSAFIAAPVFIALLVHSVVWLYNPLDAAMGFYRFVPTPDRILRIEHNKKTIDDESVADPVVSHPSPDDSAASPAAIQQPVKTPTQTSAPTIGNDSVGVVSTELKKSDDARSQLMKSSLDSIKEDPIVGKGQLYYSFDNDYGVREQSAHNFVLEYINAFGIIGFISFIIAICTVIYKIHSRRNIPEFILVLGVVGAIVVASLFQPSMLIVPISVVMYVAIATAWSSAMQHRSRVWATKES